MISLHPQTIENSNIRIFKYSNIRIFEHSNIQIFKIHLLMKTIPMIFLLLVCNIPFTKFEYLNKFEYSNIQNLSTHQDKFIDTPFNALNLLVYERCRNKRSS